VKACEKLSGRAADSEASNLCVQFPVTGKPSSPTLNSITNNFTEISSDKYTNSILAILETLAFHYHCHGYDNLYSGIISTGTSKHHQDYFNYSAAVIMSPA